MPPQILRMARRRTNAELIADAARLGYVRGRLLDATYGKGVWWRLLDGPVLDRAVGMDVVPLKVINLPRGVRGDFRRPPFRRESFDTIFHDADYKMNGTPTTPASRWVKRAADGTVDERYGVDVRKTWQARIADMLDGIAWWPTCSECDGYGHAWPGRAPIHAVLEAIDGSYEHAGHLAQAQAIIDRLTEDSAIQMNPAPCRACHGTGKEDEPQGLVTVLAPGGSLLVKCMDQVVGGKVRFQSHEVMKRAEAAGLRIAGRLDRELTPRWQDPGRKQRNEAANYSSLIILKDTRPAKRTPVSTQVTA